MDTFVLLKLPSFIFWIPSQAAHSQIDNNRSVLLICFGRSVRAHDVQEKHIVAGSSKRGNEEVEKLRIVVGNCP